MGHIQKHDRQKEISACAPKQEQINREPRHHNRARKNLMESNGKVRVPIGAISLWQVP